MTDVGGYEADIIDRIQTAIDTGEPARLLPSQIRYLREALPSPVPNPITTGVIGGPLGGVRLVVENPKGYPTHITPRPRKQRRK